MLSQLDMFTGFSTYAALLINKIVKMEDLRLVFGDPPMKFVVHGARLKVGRTKGNDIQIGLFAVLCYGDGSFTHT